jgi:hypothetical protein
MQCDLQTEQSMLLRDRPCHDLLPLSRCGLVRDCGGMGVIGGSGSCFRLTSLAFEALGLITLTISTISSSSLYSSDLEDLEVPVENVSIRSTQPVLVRTRRGC